MAISATHYHLLKELRDAGALPQGGRILEIGKANWYGDFSADEVAKEYVAWWREAYPGRTLFDGAELMPAYSRDFSGNPKQPDPFFVANLIYSVAFGIKDWPSSIKAIDLDPAAQSRGAFAIDLNTAPDGEATGDVYETVINHGTAEHIFNIANVFRVMHDACSVGGLMIHESPFTGWVDHGFYCLQPTLFWDVRAANGYEMVWVAIEHLDSRSIITIENREQILELRRRDQLPDNAMLWVAMRKTVDAPFKIPQQGVYAGTVSEATVHAWRELR